MKRWFSLVVIGLALALTGSANADYLEVRRDAWLKKAPQSDGAQIEKLSAGVLVELRPGAQQNGYYRVRTRDGKPGFVYRTLVKRHPGAMPPAAPPASDEDPAGNTPVPAATGVGPAGCGGKPLVVQFFDVGQGLSVLLDLPDHRKVLVDTGDSPKRCGAPCRAWHDHLMAGLTSSLPTTRIDAIWITHQHSDHLGGADDILARFKVGMYIDNGTDLDKPTVKRMRDAAKQNGVPVQVVDAKQTASPIPAGGDVKFTPVVPKTWSCSNPNNCSIGLRVDYCRSSILFTGDAEETAEQVLEPGGVSLLQVGHHGSNTSSSGAFLKKVKPDYAVISSGKPDEGTNATYCHPIASTVTNLTNILGGPGSTTITAFDASTVKCKDGGPANWIDVPASDHLWATARDGDVALVTTGDGVFQRVGTAPP